jgi:hypothetical protein
MRAELIPLTISAVLFIVAIICLALLVDYYIARMWPINEDTVK